jgi:2-succinyl-5-enolpyruvyl-6-hydroxy-3-cyclohexene-1-carboxylate synthase
MGIAAHHDETFAILGDLAFLHDISALSNPINDVLIIIVVDNNGGGIFSTLPQKRVEGFEKIFGTPHHRDLAKIASGFGISNEVVKSAKELKVALRKVHPAVHIIFAKMPSRINNSIFLESALKEMRRLVDFLMHNRDM